MHRHANPVNQKPKSHDTAFTGDPSADPIRGKCEFGQCPALLENTFDVHYCHSYYK